MQLHEGHRERMREQIRTSGMDSLSDVQALEYALYFIQARGDTNELAHRLLMRFGTFSQVLQAPESELLKVDGVGPRTAEFLTLFWKMERRHQMARGREFTILSSTQRCAAYLLPFFIGETEEAVYLLCLDAKCKVLDCSLVHRGAVNSALISTRKVVKKALDHNATSVVLAHNHPSGIALPSGEDQQTTRLLREALGLVDVQLVDHIIVADGDYVSMAADGML